MGKADGTCTAVEADPGRRIVDQAAELAGLAPLITYTVTPQGAELGSIAPSRSIPPGSRLS